MGRLACQNDMGFGGILLPPPLKYKKNVASGYSLFFNIYVFMKYWALGKNAGKVMKIDSYAIKHLELFHDKLHKIYSKIYQTLPLINIIIG